MAIDILTSKWAWGAICSAALITGGYRVYLTHFGPAAIQAIEDKTAIDDFGHCLTARTTPSSMKSCDDFYLIYLPKKTDPKYKKKIIETPKLDSKQIISTYDDITLLRQEYGLEDYPKLKVLSNGQLVE
ncbi:hypothetical protein [Photobacterium angustum]|uniref:Uncharacterized protein n=1 Tax=Photobacterium angustum TaxID=661 RepID=A0A855SKU8_PHOAN|nr:hypothetical protein [Photobacterium angustum]KJF82385.1 hypothetical protein UB36_06240 [Photobacterium damselae subsp. damselae]KJG41761.1 hypothetical protein UA35_04240 [Photobacterium angustum]KJG46368.1 hypothetical protein UA31_06240 [Photobacterium angustum]KJG50507.1 hypothetical protein UA30_00795 [Photobacterium angustum]KJG54376.1 hypothetical protein UA34_00805 [Photobacterium angustum]